MSAQVPNRGDSQDSMDNVTLTSERLLWTARTVAGLKQPATTAVSDGSGCETSSSGAAGGTGGLTEPTDSPPTSECALTWNSLMTAVFQQQVNEMRSQRAATKRTRSDDRVSQDRIFCLGEEEGRSSIPLDAQRTGKCHRLDLTPSTVRAHAPQSAGGESMLSPEGVQRRLSLHLLGRLSSSLPTLTEQTPVAAVAQGRNSTSSIASVPGTAASASAQPRPPTIGTPTPTPLRRYGDPSSQMSLLQDTDPPTESRPLLSQPGRSIPSPSTPLWATQDEAGDEGVLLDELDGNIIATDDNNSNTLNVGNDDDDIIVRVPLRRRPLSLQVSSLPFMSFPDTAAALQVREGGDRQLEGQGRSEAGRRMSVEEWALQMNEFFTRVDERTLHTISID
ncbi:hypothetical protein DPX39_050013800 [Trypanosoma brucei equiperdum]|uniref:Uncharacterized protein n=1 Tax=Trypanosoma brucei equiperdum TaxID=630700 RepID=A0A3L6L8C8_9TRYP|nr:hypothetical protein DPX39_050013800 [Trypanosoma brucei equiperdum]